MLMRFKNSFVGYVCLTFLVISCGTKTDNYRTAKAHKTVTIDSQDEKVKTDLSAAINHFNEKAGYEALTLTDDKSNAQIVVGLKEGSADGIVSVEQTAYNQNGIYMDQNFYSNQNQQQSWLYGNNNNNALSTQYTYSNTTNPNQTTWTNPNQTTWGNGSTTYQYNPGINQQGSNGYMYNPGNNNSFNNNCNGSGGAYYSSSYECRGSSWDMSGVFSLLSVGLGVAMDYYTTNQYYKIQNRYIDTLNNMYANPCRNNAWGNGCNSTYIEANSFYNKGATVSPHQNNIQYQQTLYSNMNKGIVYQGKK